MIWLIGVLIALDVILEVAAFALQEYKRDTVFRGFRRYLTAPNQTEMQKSSLTAVLKIRVTLLRLLLLALILLCWDHSLLEQMKPLARFLMLDGMRFKTYRGMASPDAQVEWRNKVSSHEGISSTVPHCGTLKEILTGFKV